MNRKNVSEDQKAARIYVAGHRGMVGSAIVRRLEQAGYRNIITRTHAELDLTDTKGVMKFFEDERPEIVYLAAAKVGGIWANSKSPADFIYENLQIEANVIRAAKEFEVHRLLFLGSSCIYPRDCPQPIKEEYIMTGPLEPTNRPYAMAKLAGIEMCWAFNRQHKTQFIACMPTNLYGPKDNYDLSTSHVLPALLRKIHEAKLARESKVEVWGTGRVKREFLHVDDMADACVFLINLPAVGFSEIAASESSAPVVNIGCGEDISIRELAELIGNIVGFTGTYVFDTSKPDGTPRKLLDITKMNVLGWERRISLRDGIESTYKEYLRQGLQLN